MKRKSLLFLLLFALIAPWAANAQEKNLTVFDGTNTNSYVPFYGFYADYGTRSQFIIPASELEALTTGTISKLTFYSSSGSLTYDEGVTVYLKEVNYTTFASAALEDWSTMTSVYTGTIGVTSNQMVIELSTPYTYGGGNLMIGFQVTTWGSSCPSSSWYGENQASSTYTAAYNNANSSHTWSNTVSRVSFIPKTTFTYTGGTAITCFKPTDLAASNVTSNAATLTWQDESADPAWTLQYSTNNTFAEGTYSETSVTGTPTANLSGLTSATTYYARVKPNCDTDGTKWSSIATFNTQCATYDIPYTYGFEDAAPFACWTVISGNITRISGTPNTGSYRLDFRGTTSNMIALPQFYEPTNNLRVEFYTRPESTGGNSGKFAVGYMTDIADASTFVAVSTYNSTEMTTTYVKKTVDFVGVPANANIAMRQFDCSTNFYWYVDDVTVKEMPSCLAPTGLAANATTTSAELSWTANSGETAWTLYWKKTTDETYTEVPNATNPYTLNGLDAATNYQYYVVANCSADDASEPSEVFPFVTECEVINALGYSENFDSYTAGNNVLPTCWSYINTTTNSTYAVYPRVYANTSYSTYASSAPNCLYFYSNGSSDPQPQYAILPEMTGLAGLQVTLMAKGYNATSTLKIGTMSDPTDASTFRMIAEQTLTTSYPTDPFEFIIPADCRDSYLAIMIDAAPSGYNTRGVYVDDIVISEAPTCLKPTDLVATSNALTATFTWVSEVGEYEVAHATDATATPDENIAGTATEATYTMNDLALGDHYFWVRANCGTDGYSEWVGPVSVHIGYCVPAPTNVDGNGISNVTFGMGDNVVNNNTSMGTSVATYLDYSNQIGAVQAGVEATVAITYATGYTYGTIIWVDLDNSLSFEDSEIVYTGTSGSDNPTTLNASITISATQTPGDYMMRIGGADSGFDSYISGSSTTAPSACYTGTWACFQDYTLRVLEAPSCLMPTNVTINYTGGTTAQVTWEGTAETYNIDVNGTVTNNVTTPYTIENLDMATTYNVKVQANCEDDEISEWTAPVRFTTDLCLPEDMCEISYSFADQYNDSWNGASINVIDVASNTVIVNLTMPYVDGPYKGSFNVCDGQEIQFVWVSGTYDSECSYVFTDSNNEVILQGSGAMSGPVNYTVDCPACPAPTNLAADNIATESATLTWEGTSDSYVVQYRPWLQVGDDQAAPATITTFTFDLSDYSGMGSIAIRHYNISDIFSVNVDDIVVTNAQGETVFSENFEGSISSAISIMDLDGDGYIWSLGTTSTDSQGNPTGNGNYYVTSSSYDNNVGALTPDNWLVISDVELGGQLTFVARALDPEWTGDNFGVFVSAEEGAGEETVEGDNSIDLWDLTPNTSYTWQVKGVCGEDESQWASSFFTTLDDYLTFVIDGDWNDANNWNPAQVPTTDKNVHIEANAIIPAGVVAEANNVTINGGSITIKDGGQMKLNSQAEVVMEKEITGYGEGNGNYYLIASPFTGRTQFGASTWSHVDSLIYGTYDLYTFDPANGEDEEWVNYKANPEHIAYQSEAQGNQGLFEKYGYLYANHDAITLVFTGKINKNIGKTDTKAIAYEANKGWALVGNIYACNAYLSFADEEGDMMEANYWVMNAAGDDLELAETADGIAPITAAFVNFGVDGYVQINSEEPTRYHRTGKFSINLSQDGNTVDKAVVRFGKGLNLEKMSLKNNSKLYFSMKDKDYAVVYTMRQGEMPVNFKAETAGSYTISCAADGVNFKQLVLVDNVNGTKVDLLANPSYTFETEAGEFAKRFTIVYATK